MKQQRPILKSIPHKSKQIILDYLISIDFTYSKDEDLLEDLGLELKHYRKLEDMLKYLTNVEKLLKQEKEGRKHIWKLLNKKTISKEMASFDADRLQYAIELNRNEYDEDTLETIESMFKANSSTLLGQLPIFEDLNSKNISKMYNILTKAINEHKYLKLTFKEMPLAIYNEVKPIKLLFLDNNWYLAFEYKNFTKNENVFKFGRLSFILEVSFLEDSKYSNKNTFQTKDLKKYLDFLNSVQNSMTLYGVNRKTARLKATGMISKYFEDGMKKFLSSQTFVKKEDDGSVIFTVEYTQELEILPFIQKWMPELIILQPQELKDAYIKKLAQTIKNLK